MKYLWLFCCLIFAVLNMAMFIAEMFDHVSKDARADYLARSLGWMALGKLEMIRLGLD